MLELYVAPQLEEFQLWIIFEQDGAHPHWGSHVRRFLDAIFPNSWIGRDGPTPWPPRSPDITTLDFVSWGYVKGKVFSTPVPDITNFEGKNNRRFCYNNWRHVGEQVERNDHGLDVLRATKGAHVEVYWCVVKKNFLCYILENKNICLYSTYSNFLLINVCNQGKTLCSPCIYIFTHTVKPGYNDIGLYDSLPTASDTLWYQLITHC